MHSDTSILLGMCLISVVHHSVLHIFLIFFHSFSTLHVVYADDRLVTDKRSTRDKSLYGDEKTIRHTVLGCTKHMCQKFRV